MIWAQEPDGATRDQPKQGKHAAMLKTQNGVRCLGQNTHAFASDSDDAFA